MADRALYLITPNFSDSAAFCSELDAALRAAAKDDIPVACVQLRLKEKSDEVILAAATAVREVTAAHGVAFLVNDRADLAARLSADGVHLGQQDGDIGEARRLLGEEADIGVTCHASRHLAMIAAEEGADYVAFGAFYPSETKDSQYRAELSLVEDWTLMTTMPCVAIGGLTAENSAPVLAAGADYLAVCGAVFAHPEGAAAGIRKFAPLFGHA
ncbi:thiamine-phosphate pyrophosphorylase [Parvularcula bermudensis HTCC2503]|uniref:Thiamine-phosphate synthase n=1 Tax=Parvularcula bermudensis (strain ATCC BAA-594 / HTCC2503 / KCTC 12087) TaxID=314260 RepID=E0TCN2_PARBH|nr:thiamine phosphate synthase [Parvularcula bermudensis]ADM08621.1 thiamine-phosphate pyrophosphorylase [Parvularcula bermudensis HTCC2503]